jgi:tetratricopeptide (TPR) repeat protein
MAIARELSPMKQSIIAQQAIVAYSQGNIVKARDWFAEDFRLDERNIEAREFYAAMLFLNGEQTEGRALAFDEATLNHFTTNEFLIRAVNDSGDFNFLVELYKIRTANDPQTEQNWVSLSFAYKQIGDIKSSAETLRQAAAAKPAFAKKANCFANNIEAGKDNPEEGC